jgi:class 3 adenylate cyclase/DNA-binding response OmpR family regulator
MSASINAYISNPEKFVIWVVEDDALLNNVIVRSIQNASFNCHSFLSGSEVLEYLWNDEDPKDVNPIILLDFLLDDMNAIELLGKLKEMDRSFPFVIMTGFGDEKTAVELMKLGAVDYIVKEKNFVNKTVKVIQQAQEKLDTNYKLEKSRRDLEESTEKLKLLNQQISLQKLSIENEKAKIDKLLQCVLPKSIAKELLEKGFTKPRQYENVSILFADVIGFSDMAKVSDPLELVTRLDNYFYIFDEIIEQHGLEKIKTIGDCYMCAGGIPEENEFNPAITTLTGLKIQNTINKLKDEYKSIGSELRLRLGIHTGDVVAGVVGKIKFAYDIWGDAVNIASRIVEAGEKDKVNVSEKTYHLIKDFFICTKRGEIDTKRNKPMKMYFVERLKPEFSADDNGLIANEKLLKRLNLNRKISYY